MESDRFPYLPVRISLGPLVVEVMAFLDTGFDGALALPFDWSNPVDRRTN